MKEVAGVAGTKPFLRRRRFVRVVTGVGIMTGMLAGVLGAGKADAYPASPAFYTYQAPYGASTAGKKVISLGFDDGPSIYTPQVLSVLEQFHVPATFFDIGEEVANYPQYAKEVVAAGYPVENHTWSHPDLAQQSAATVQYQIQSAQQEIESVTGTTPTCLRPPYNAWNNGVLDQVAENGLQTMSYSIDPKDWELPGTQAIVNAVVGAAFPGAVVDMHDGGGNRSETVAALPRIITALESEGYTFVGICGAATPAAPPPPPPLHVSSVNSFGTAPAAGAPTTSKVDYVGAAATESGYWMAAANGGVFAVGAPFDGSMGNRGLSSPISGIASTAAGDGYRLVSQNGGVFAFGNAGFYGSMGKNPPRAAVVGIATDPATGGYWLVTSAGGIFSFNAPFEGSMSGRSFHGPIVGMASTSDGNGYWLVSAAGAVFSFGDAVYHGGEGGQALGSPIVGIASDWATGGYWLASSKGGIFALQAPYDGSMAAEEGSNTVFAVTAPPNGSGYMEMASHPVAQP